MRWVMAFVGAALTVAACSSTSAPESSQAPAAAYQPVVTLNEIMVNIVDPHAHELWDAVVPPKEPKTDEDWRNIRHAAATLAAGGSLTMMSGNGPKDAVWRQQKDWGKLSQAVSDAGREAVVAVQNRSVPALSRAGDNLLQACLNCHKEYKLETPQITADPQLHKGEF